jgi:hypothetical protein
MSVAKTKIGKLEFTFVYRYRYEKYKDNSERLFKHHTMWREWQLGLFFRRNKIVGKKNFNKPKEWGNNLVTQYMVGIDLLIWKLWFTVHKGGMSFKLNE